jgi:hypothetical protein
LIKRIKAGIHLGLQREREKDSQKEGVHVYVTATGGNPGGKSDHRAAVFGRVRIKKSSASGTLRYIWALHSFQRFSIYDREAS